MNMIPLGDRIIIKRTESDPVTKGGIIIPDNAQEKQTRGKVIAVGRGKHLMTGQLVEPQVKKGDVVLFNKYSGVEVQIDGEEHIVAREDDILCIMTE